MTVSVHEAKTHLSRLLQLRLPRPVLKTSSSRDPLIQVGAASGPARPADRSRRRLLRACVAEHRPVFGVDEGRFVVPDDFDDPLDEELLRAFEGRSE